MLDPTAATAVGFVILPDTSLAGDIIPAWRPKAQKYFYTRYQVVFFCLFQFRFGTGRVFFSSFIVLHVILILSGFVSFGFVLMYFFLFFCLFPVFLFSVVSFSFVLGSFVLFRFALFFFFSQAEDARQIKIASPILNGKELEAIQSLPGFKTTTVSTVYPLEKGPGGLQVSRWREEGMGGGGIAWMPLAGRGLPCGCCNVV